MTMNTEHSEKSKTNNNYLFWSTHDNIEQLVESLEFVMKKIVMNFIVTLILYK